MKDKAMDAVLDERPQEPAQQKEQRENVLMDRDREVWEHTHTDIDIDTIHTHTHTSKMNENKHVVLYGYVRTQMRMWIV